MGASYVGLVYIRVYVGAISRLFIFLVRRLAPFNAVRGSVNTSALPLAAALILTLTVGLSPYLGSVSNQAPTNWFPTNIIDGIGRSLYTNGAIRRTIRAALFIVGRIGPIVLCLRRT